MAWRHFISQVAKVLTPLMAGKAVAEAKKTVQKKTDEYIDKKSEAFVSHAKTEAEEFMAKQMMLLEARIDEKILEIEKMIDEQIEKELRNKLKILIYTLAALILMSLVSLGYLYLKRRFGL
ncbi:MAG: hypothetical protein ACE5F7_06355 [Nitrospiria bacterium]